MHIADARATFKLGAALSPAAYADLIAIPGVEPWHGRRTRIVAPITAAWIVESYLDNANAPYTVRADSVDTFDDTALREQLIAGGVYPWVIDAFAAPFQLEAVAACAKFGSGLLRAEPGAGKTLVSALWATMTPMPTLVVTLASAVPQWAAEARRFTSLPVFAYRPASRMRASDVPLESFVARAPGVQMFCVFGWEHLVSEGERFTSLLRSRFGGFQVIFDESQMARNYKRAKWTQGAEGLVKHPQEHLSSAAARIAEQAKRRLCTTATPIANRVKDLWGQLTMMEPHGWGQTATRFLLRYCDARPGEFGGLDANGISKLHLPELLDRMSFFTHDVPYSVSHGQLPPKRRMLLRIAADAQVREAESARAETAKLAKAATDDDGRDALIERRLQRAASRKRNEIARLVSDEWANVGKGKVIVFTGRRKDADLLGEKLGKAGLRVFVGHGDHTVDARHALLREYMAAPTRCVLVGTVGAWGRALNIDDTDVVCFAMLPYTPEQVAQAEGRADRLSMTRPVLYVYTVAEGTIDEHITSLVLDKMTQTEAITPNSRLAAMGGLASTLRDDARRSEILAALAARLCEEDSE